MPEWTRPPEGSLIIAHVSDLHFGSAHQDECWRVVQHFLSDIIKPNLLLITGDLVDFPNRELFEAVKDQMEAMKIPYYVCPGNHDRHWKGNASRFLAKLKRTGDTPAVFDQVFGWRLAVPNEIVVPDLGTQRLRIGLLGVDTSRDADYSARGFLRDDNISALEGALASKGADIDLAILLVHHHLQPVRRLEDQRRGHLRDLANVTSMVNAGSLLERLAKMHVDLALHGHEHAPHWARYGSLEGRLGEIAVIGAGSATGNDSFSGCSLARASFNLIVISEAGSVRLWILSHDSGDWRIAENIQIFDWRSSRRLRLLRRVENLKSPLTGRITKYVEFTRSRDIHVHWVFSNWFFDRKQIQFSVENSNGRPDDPSLVITTPSHRQLKLDVGFKKDSKKDFSWFIAAEMDDDSAKDFLNLPVQCEFSFKWQGGGLLTSEEMVPLKEGAAPGPLRREGLEFASVRTHGSAIESAQLILVVPAEFAPPEGVDVRVFDERDVEHKEEAQELEKLVLTLGPGRYSLTVPSPRESWWYALAWRPVDSSRLGVNQAFLAASRSHGGEILKAFQAALSPAVVWDKARLSLYLLDRGSARRVAHIPPSAGPGEGGLVPPDDFAIRRDSSAIGQAFSGVPISSWRPASEQLAQDIGFLRDEDALFFLPVRFDLSWTNPAPWAAVRIGHPSRDDVTKVTDLSAVLQRGVLSLLTTALK
jgi:3',5'-cyclic AMP phosphodiesterase CpdA